MSIGNIDYRLLTTSEELKQFRDNWEELYAKSTDSSPYLCYDWISMILKYFGFEENGFCVGILHEYSKVIAIVPLKITKKRVGPTYLKTLNFFGEGWPPKNGAILADQASHPAVVQDLIGNLLQRDRKIRFCLLIRVPLGSPFMEPPLSAAIKCDRLRTVKLKTGRSVLIKLPKTWNTYLKGLSNAHRKTVTRRINAMERDYDLRLIRLGFDNLTRCSDLNKLIQDALKISRKSWQGSAVHGRAISDPDTAAFFYEVSLKLATRGMLDLSILYADQQPVSFIWGASRWPFSTILKLGFDPAYGKYSPGTIHLAKLIDDSIKRGGTEIDFGHEFYDYKSRWSKQYVELYSVYYFPKRIVPTMIQFGFLLKQKIKKISRKGVHGKSHV